MARSISSVLGARRKPWEVTSGLPGSHTTHTHHLLPTLTPIKTKNYFSPLDDTFENVFQTQNETKIKNQHHPRVLQEKPHLLSKYFDKNGARERDEKSAQRAKSEKKEGEKDPIFRETSRIFYPFCFSRENTQNTHVVFETKKQNNEKSVSKTENGGLILTHNIVFSEKLRENFRENTPPQLPFSPQPEKEKTTFFATHYTTFLCISGGKSGGKGGAKERNEFLFR